MLGFEDKPRPRDSALQDIGSQHGTKAPALQMGSLNWFIEDYSETRRAQTITQFNVFDRRPREALFIEAADLLKDRLTDRAAAGPKCRRFGVPLLMNEMVQQIAILWEQTGRPRRCIVGTKNSGYIGPRCKALGDFLQRIRRQYHIGIDKHEDIAVSMARPVITRSRRPRVLS